MSVTCHAMGDQCLGCPHYHGKADVCTFSIDLVSSASQAWQELLDKDDRNSPEDYPEMCLITFGELREFMSRGTMTAQPTAAISSKDGGSDGCL